MSWTIILRDERKVAATPERGINNGQPALHARCLAELAPLPGEQAVHIGAGGGYYTGILAEMVGPRGSVDAYEIEVDLAKKARTNLKSYGNVELHAGSASNAPLAPSDIIYVNAGVRFAGSDWWLSTAEPVQVNLTALTRV